MMQTDSEGREGVAQEPLHLYGVLDATSLLLQVSEGRIAPLMIESKDQ